jgi:galactoside O-acetyltransferase
MFYNREELEKMGFKSLGDNVLISDKASIYNAKYIEIGSNVRIDDFVILSPATSLVIGDYIHIGCYTSIIGKGKIVIEDYCSISGRVSIYSSNDNYTGLGMTNPMVPINFRRVVDGDVTMKKHSIIGSGSIVLPNVTLEEGAAVGALSLVNKNCDKFTIYSGIPAIKIGKRQTKFLKYEEELRRYNQ